MRLVAMLCPVLRLSTYCLAMGAVDVTTGGA